jgi:hypothetical protein
VHGAERGVAVPHVVDQDPDAHQVVDVGEVATAHDHLLVDRVVVLRAAGHRGADLGRLELGADPLDHLGQLGVARRRALGHQADDLVVPLGVERGEGEVLELPLQRVHAEPVRERGEDLQRLPGDPLLLLLLQPAQGAHVVQPVGQLDDQHPRVPGHRHDHLADRLGLGGVAELDLVELGHPVDEVPDVDAELAAHVVEGVAGVLDGVVQQARHQRRGVHPELGQDGRHGQRMGDVRVAAASALALVALLGHLVGAHQGADVRLGVAGPHDPGQRLEHGRDAGGLGGRQAGQPGADPAAGRRARGLGGRCVRTGRSSSPDRGRADRRRHRAGRYGHR